MRKQDQVNNEKDGSGVTEVEVRSGYTWLYGSHRISSSGSR